VKQIKKIITVIGARPQIIKSAAITREIQTNFINTLQEKIIHTGQHYDANMSNVFFQELELPNPKYHLNVGSANHGTQTAKMIQGIEEIFINEKPNATIVYGDTNSTLSASIVASKLKIPIIHIEAGLRGYDKTMPEETNRIICDHLSTLLFAPTANAVENLNKESIVFDKKQKVSVNNPKIIHCGDIMYDNSLYFSKKSDEKSIFCKKNKLVENQFVLCTIHRPINTDNPKRLNNILNALLIIQKTTQKKIVFPIHPRTKNKLKDLEMFNKLKNINEFVFTEPIGFLDMIAVEKNAKIIITDSGGVQKEAFFFQKPCVVLRRETEWKELIENKNAILADDNTQKIIQAFKELTNKTDFTYPKFYGNGKTANYICEQILKYLN